MSDSKTLFREVNNHYDALLQSKEESHAKVGWGSRESQLLRFDVLFDFTELTGARVLDVGCGLGAMWEYLNEKGISCSYMGWDLSPAMIEQASQLYPEAEFRCVNFLDDEASGESFDVVFLSGALNLPVDGQPAVFLRAIERLYALSIRAAAFTVLSSKADFLEPGEWYGSPGKIMEFCLTLTRKVVLRHDYMPHDFSLCMYHE